MSKTPDKARSEAVIMQGFFCTCAYKYKVSKFSCIGKKKNTQIRFFFADSRPALKSHRVSPAASQGFVSKSCKQGRARSQCFTPNPALF